MITERQLVCHGCGMPIDEDDEVVAVDSEHSSGAAARLSLVLHRGAGVTFWHARCAAEQFGAGTRTEPMVKPARGWSGRILDWALFAAAAGVAVVTVFVYGASEWLAAGVFAAAYVILGGAVFLVTGRLPISTGR